MRRSIFAVQLCCLLIHAQWAISAEPTADSKAIVTHLVGHEDHLLLERVQEVIDDWDPRKLVNPYVGTTFSEDANGNLVKRRYLKRADLSEFIADPLAAEILGKAFFWEMRAGSDYRKINPNDGNDNSYVGTACASCHYRFGADARNRHTQVIPFVLWERYMLDKNHGLAFGERQLEYNVDDVARSDFVRHAGKDLSLLVGSQGVYPGIFEGFENDSDPWKELAISRTPSPNGSQPEFWEMFKGKNKQYRMITLRNSPSVYNAGFSDRLFHDGRAESTFNGFSIFGDFDQREVLFRVNKAQKIVPARIAIVDAALASQAVGPIVNDVEMSYTGRTLHDVAKKLLDAPVLQHQKIDANDSLLGTGVLNRKNGSRITYRELIKRAFRNEWWDDSHVTDKIVTLHLTEPITAAGDKRASGSIMQANFGLYWGLALMLYQAELVTNESPFDAMMKGDGKPVEDLWKQLVADGEPFFAIQMDREQTRVPKPNGEAAPDHKTGTAVFQHGLRVFINRNCVECHSGPLFSELSERARFEDKTLPIAKTHYSTLLPNAQADAIALKRDAFHHETLNDVAKILDTVQGVEGRGERIARDLDLLRDASRGTAAGLEEAIQGRLATISIDCDKLKQIVNAFLTFERTYQNQVGNRLFFTEPERVALAEQLVEPLLVEMMLVPSNQRSSRRPLVIDSPIDRTYAFYDLAFYNIGVSPPRHDRGNGNAEATLYSLAEQAARNVIMEMSPLSFDEADRSKGDELIKKLEEGNITLQQALDDSTEGVRNSALRELASAFQNGHSAKAASSGAPGQAYRFNPAWKSGRTLEKFSNSQIAPQPADTSWDRDDLPRDARRASFHFFSRSRQLVMNELPWGYRKPFVHDNELSFWGAFRTPSLRNVSLTAPYMHSGRLMSLAEVVRFYAKGGDIPRHMTHNPDKHPEIIPFQLPDNDLRALVFFLHCLTDSRVRAEKAPFDHPEIRLVNGYNDDGTERLCKVSATGANGGKHMQVFPTEH